jgi:serine/threonine-protein kinase
MDDAKAVGAVSRVGLAAGDVLAGRFRIVRHLGSGGMGDVFEAIDLLMGEGRIALKTIRPDMIEDAEQMARFKNEVQLARRVTNRHVCRIHELFLMGEEGERQAFLTMEFLEGMTLADRLRVRGPLEWPEARRVALEICEALESIHEAGVIHRDLKGRNIMLAERNGSPCTVLMDFGIARAISRHTGETMTAMTALTKAGAMVGTPEYMAPEQFDGSEITEATDVYALGIVLCEMVTGERPERGTRGTVSRTARARSRDAASQAGVSNLPSNLASKAHSNPQSKARSKAAGSRASKAGGTKSGFTLSAYTLQTGVPRSFSAVVGKCIEYDAARRYQTAREVADAVRGQTRVGRLTRGPVAAVLAAMLMLCALLLVPAVRDRARGMLLSSSEKHVAVLPFEMPTDEPQVVAVGDGLMDSLAGDLANLDVVNKTLWVIPASEIRARKVTTAAAAMQEFGATIVISGSFTRDPATGARLRLTLIDPKKNREIGFVDVASIGGDLAAMEDEAIAKIGRLMDISVKPDLVRAGAGSGAAYEDYLAGAGYFQRFDKPGNLQLATAALEAAVKKDPRFTIGYANLAQVYLMRYRIEKNPEFLKQAEANAKQAAELDDKVASTYVALAQVHDQTGNHDLAIQEYKQAAELDPRDAEAINGLAHIYQNEGRNQDAESEFAKAAAVRPNDWFGYSELGNFYDQTGRPKDAVAQYKRALELTPDNSAVYANLANAYMDIDGAESAAAAEEALKRSIAINPSYAAFGNLGFLYSKEHRFRESIEATRKALEFNDKSYDLWANLTAAYEWVKDDSEADAARARTIAILEASVKRNPQSAEARAMLAALLAKNGDRERAMDGIGISLALAPKNQYVLSQVADAYELLGDRADAIRYLEDAFAQGLPMQQPAGDPEIQGVLSDPKFKVPAAVAAK